ncbi:hypothetical protein FHX37_4618 [Haloactinospora alba]|uniref:Uncharacterized protein n=1 Tax=Haloactinospora alba TaxID=405555 RepID=A0A543N2N2_9ACTN|nr:hypothetical protein [Haloactinospora alba]TQN26080.1 hypothetical protein FHX37_4618 [Haloactinospora alba]
MATVQDLTLYEGNDETVSLAVTDADEQSAYDLTDAELDMILKPNADTADDADETIVLSTRTGEITVTDAPAGLATATVNRPHLAESGRRAWRLDVIRPGTRRTAVYGTLHVVNL